MANTQYDPQVLQKLVDKLYARAASTIFVHALFGFLLGLAAAGGLSVAGGARASMGILIGVVALVTGVGAYIGEQKANQLRIQAQTLLLAMQTEVNTRQG